jgi:hypothetical protein
MFTLRQNLLAKINNLGSYLCCIITFQGTEHIFVTTRQFFSS